MRRPLLVASVCTLTAVVLGLSALALLRLGRDGATAETRPRPKDGAATETTPPTDAVLPANAKAQTVSDGLPPPHPLGERAVVFRKRLHDLRFVRTGDEETQRRITEELLAYLTDANLEAVIKSLDPLEFDTPFGLAALERWMKLSPLDAAAWMGARDDKAEVHAWIVATALARDTKALDSFADQTESSPWRDGILAAAGRELADADPGHALALAFRMPPGPGATDLMETTLYSWATRDNDAASAWAGSVGDAALRERLLAMTAKARMLADPEAGARQLVASVSDASLLSANAETAATLWFEKDRSAVAFWAASLPQGPARTAALRTLAETWTAKDRAAALAWLGTLPEGPELLQQFAFEKPATTFEARDN